MKKLLISAFYGTDDQLVKNASGQVASSLATRLVRTPAKRLSFPPVRLWIDAWAQRNGCEPEPEVYRQMKDVTALRFSGPEKASEIISTRFFGGDTARLGFAHSGRQSKQKHQCQFRYVGVFKKHSL
jgi:hypothetical protein